MKWNMKDSVWGQSWRFTFALSSWIYLATAPYAKSSTLIRLDPEKSTTDPSSLHIPTCPMKGANHETTGRGVQTKQQGNFAFFRSISPSGHSSCWILRVEILSSTPNVGFSSIIESLPEDKWHCTSLHSQTCPP